MQISKTSTSDASKRSCVFLDRDGVINVGGLINAASDVKLIDGVVEAISSLKEAGFLVGVCTNQGGLSEDFEGNVVWKQRPLTAISSMRFMRNCFGCWETLPDLIL